MTSYSEKDLKVIGQKIMKKLANFEGNHEFTLIEFEAAINPLQQEPSCGFALKKLQEEGFLELYYINQQPLISITVNGAEFANSLKQNKKK